VRAGQLGGGGGPPSADSPVGGPFGVGRRRAVVLAVETKGTGGGDRQARPRVASADDRLCGPDDRSPGFFLMVFHLAGWKGLQKGRLGRGGGDAPEGGLVWHLTVGRCVGGAAGPGGV